MSFAVLRHTSRLILSRRADQLRYYSQKTCWKCDGDAGGGHFCHSCNTILPPPEGNLFEYVGLPKRFAVDENALKKKFRDLQFKLHPDKFAQSTTRERELSEEHSRRLNKAYRTLSEPLARANYLLKLEGVDKKGDLNQEALMEIMEWNEHVASLSEEDELKKEVDKVDKDVEDEMDCLAEAFEKGNYIKAKDHITLLTYLYSIRTTLDRKLQTFLKS